jgi:hypothetical protein
MAAPAMPAAPAPDPDRSWSNEREVRDLIRDSPAPELRGARSGRSDGALAFSEQRRPDD